MLAVDAALVQRRSGVVLAASRMPACVTSRSRPLSRPSFLQTRNITVPKSPDDMGGPGGQEHFPESNALRRYVPVADCRVTMLS
jgi:hypothetical protein